jgi:hypothetical protein
VVCYLSREREVDIGGNGSCGSPVSPSGEAGRIALPSRRREEVIPSMSVNVRSLLLARESNKEFDRLYTSLYLCGRRLAASFPRG